MVEEIALIRVLNSRKEAEEIAGLFLRADPPVLVDVFDTRTSAVLGW